VLRSAIADLERIAAAQHGLFTTEQAYLCGLTLSALRNAVARGWLRSVRRSVYAFTGRPPSRWEPILAAWLAAGPGAIISHWSAAAIHGFWGVTGLAPELMLPGQGGRRMNGVRIHRFGALLPEDVVQLGQVQVTSPIRTLLDLTGSTSEYLLARMLDEGAVARLWRAEQIVERLDSAGGEHRLNTPRLRHLLELRLDEASPDSLLEQRVIRVIKPRLPAFVVHHRIALQGRTVELDVAWPEYLLAAEIDGRHVRVASRTKFDSDRLRSNLLEMHGWRVVHLSAGMDDMTILAQLVPFFPPTLIDQRVRSGPGRAGRRR
jgi:very-short-patch-repair endonuclease